MTGTTIHQIDLDLDVVLTHDGEVAVIDEDEFIDHQQRIDYPDEIIDFALTAAREAQARLKDRSSPFDGVADTWLDRVETSSLA